MFSNFHKSICYLKFILLPYESLVVWKIFGECFLISLNILGTVATEKHQISLVSGAMHILVNALSADNNGSIKCAKEAVVIHY